MKHKTVIKPLKGGDGVKEVQTEPMMKERRKAGRGPDRQKENKVTGVFI